MDKSSNNFISYVGMEEHEMQQINSSRRNSVNDNNVKLLPGEVVIAEAQSVLMFSPVSDLKQGISGILAVTNFKLTFITTEDSNSEDINRQQNHFYGYTDSCLTNIDEIYLIIGDKKRKLMPGSTVPSKVKGIFIVCKNFRTWSFSFKFSPVGHGKNLLTTLLHHAFPRRHQLLFAYDYKEPYYSSIDKKIKLFRSMSDWQNELNRTSCNNEHTKKNWRLSSANLRYQLSTSLPEYIIVPASVTDSQLSGAASHFQDNRPPVWSWSNHRGAALVKMSELIPTISEPSDHLNSGTSVILQENAGRDLCCVISSLVQLILDPYFRTITGFQTLLQKEWVAAGHPFCDRLGHIIKPNGEKSPIFLIYLDCVWQLCQQYPSKFEFTETYLTSLWDTAHVSIFDTFIFNCERDRTNAATDINSSLVLRSVWDWREQFTDQDILLFYSPFFNSADEEKYLKPQFSVSCLELWTQCYFRWIPPLEIRNGGKNHSELYARLLQNSISQLKVNINGNCVSPVDKINTFLVQMNINSFYPFGNKHSGNTVSTPIMNNSMLMTESFIDAQSLLTAPD
ncbi:hypothetical protein G9C98_007253 [Cotesia typhae]|uniref:Myotubularin phosphatase domain-containing protein n=1 Tax=Cotesia typhae TaxID=2053667 RepID=A0A8J5RKU0_9HYME|nr:hypothetical protein G9C98_007253 [Cotesia typhae]